MKKFFFIIKEFSSTAPPSKKYAILNRRINCWPIFRKSKKYNYFCITKKMSIATTVCRKKAYTPAATNYPDGKGIRAFRLQN